MTNAWKSVTLVDAIQLQRGHDLPTPQRRPGDIPILGSFGVTGWHDTARGKAPGVAIGRSGGSIGTATYINQDYWPLNTVLFVTDFRGNDPRWIYYLLDWIDFSGHNSGSAQPSLNRNYLANIPINLPAPDEQAQIATTLGALDDKISSNQRAIDLMDEIASTVCQQVLGTAATPWELLWPEQKLGEVLEVLEAGKRPDGGVAGYKAGVPSLGAESIRSAGYYDFSKVRYVPDGFAGSMSKGVLRDFDVLVYKDGGTPGNFEPHVSAFGNGFPFDQAVINEHVYRMRVRPPYSQAFLYFWLRSERVMAEMRRRGTGAAIPGLNSSSVRELPIIDPPLDLLQRLQLKLDPLLVATLRLAKEGRRLELLRNTLLPELMSGRRRISREKQTKGSNN